MHSEEPRECEFIRGAFHIDYEMLSSYPYKRLQILLVLQTEKPGCKSIRAIYSNIFSISSKDPLSYIHLLDSSLNKNLLVYSDAFEIQNSLENPEESILPQGTHYHPLSDKRNKLFNISLPIEMLAKISFSENNFNLKLNEFTQEIIKESTSLKIVKFINKIDQDSFMVIYFKDSDEEFQNEYDGLLMHSHNSLMKFCGVLNKSRSLFFLYNSMTSLKKKVLLEDCSIRKRLAIGLEICQIFLYFHAKGQHLLPTLSSFAISSCQRIVLVRIRPKKSFKYSPPEFFLDILSEKSGLYALAMILYAVIFGTEPFDYKKNVISEEQFLQNIIFYEKRPEIPKIVPYMQDEEYLIVVPKVEGLLVNLWETSPEDRISLLIVEEQLRMLVNKFPENSK